MPETAAGDHKPVGILLYGEGRFPGTGNSSLRWCGRPQKQLVEAQEGSLGTQRRVFLLRVQKAQGTQALFRQSTGNSDPPAFPGREIRQGHCPLLCYGALRGQLPGKADAVRRVLEVPLVGEGNFHKPGFCTKQGSAQGAHDIPEFQKARMGSAVRIDQPIHAEIAVVGEFAEVPSVAVYGFPFRSMAF